MKLAITQPNYLPWLGYFEMLDEVDLWVSLDNVQATRRSFIVRNRIERQGGQTCWLTVSLSGASRTTPIDQARLARQPRWWERHLNLIEQSYRDAPHFAQVFPWLQSVLPPLPEERVLGRYNERILEVIMERLGVEVERRRASELVATHALEFEGQAQDKILALCDLFEAATAYYNFAGGVERGLYEAEAFAERGMALYKQDYHHPTYSQRDGSFTPYLSVVDVLMYQPTEIALKIVRQGRNWVRV